MSLSLHARRSRAPSVPTCAARMRAGLLALEQVRVMGVGDDDDLFTLEDDDPREDSAAAAAPWVVMIVDDDRDVHESTVLALRTERVLGRPLVFVHAYSGAEALALLEERPDVNVMLLDVVMETADAGLRVASRIRADGRFPDLKIIIRTGQPGSAPETMVARDYAIDGYVTKEKLSRTLLLEAITGSLENGGAGPPGSVQ